MPAVGQNLAHDSARTHVTGQSVFLDDLAPLAGELLAGIVPSPHAHGRLLKLDTNKAAQIPGVAAALTAADVPGHNRFGPVVVDEDLLVEEYAVFLGQPLALIAADSPDTLHEAIAAVEIDMEPLPPILSIDEAMAAESWLSDTLKIERGDLAAGFDRADHVIEGTLDIGGQEQFYLESQIAIATPGEQGQMHIQSSTQHTTEVQEMVAEVLGVPFNHVICTCKRMGGAFGGKETQAAPPAMMAALLAHRTRRPIRFLYHKDDDMRFTGKRHPFKSFYKAGVTHDGRITALDVRLFSNGGCSTDLSPAVLERALLHTDNTCYVENLRVTGRICKTNLPSNTAFRGFGGPQGVASTENILEHAARQAGLDPLDVRQRNVYGIDDRNTTHYGQTVANNTLPELFAAIRNESDYDARRADVARFNQTSPTHLRGLAVSGVKFGISFTRRAMNQANALVNIYHDGSVMVSTGATEMGQGVNTRIRQIVADELGVPYDRVLVAITSTEKNNNTSPTAASAGTDLNGAAAADACSRLRGRLADVAAGMLGDATAGRPPEPANIRFSNGFAVDTRTPQTRVSFGEIVAQAYEQRVSLGERGFYATPGVDFNRATGRGNPFLYYTNGVACTEVLIDRFTGQYEATRVDLIMDVGQSINPGIDRGQVVGGFVQGMGWCTTEELIYSPTGELLAPSPTTYKIPAVTDVPKDFRVRFLDNPNNVVSLRRSKAVGEPPLLLGLSAWLAIKDAVAQAEVRPTDRGTASASLPLPATGEQVLLTLDRLSAASETSGRVSRGGV
ncbi:MAG: xanthine dehydrogenase molybdopterin binding subunit [Planctomycetota bacterium]